ncbi:murein hydrolase activator EnvC family protein [Paenirhodobacter populi]|uniref:Peptidase M23 n=1 Tax=Paenirhodobacter populi TaxID=2306993 RepID=A0A443INE4_9RHOB|nr:peptidase M23 [Sinirhodobacter populi]
MRAALLACLIASATAAMADSSTDAALNAAAGLREAVSALNAAQTRSDRIAALTTTITAYEEGLSALRGGLRRAAIREQEIEAGFSRKRAELGRLLGMMSTMQQSEGPLLLLHPAGALGSARSGMVMGSIAPALQDEAEKMRASLEEIAALRAVQGNAEQVLEEGLASVQAARTSLSQAISERTDLPRRYLEDPEELRSLVDSAKTLDEFATGMAGIDSDIGPPLADFDGAKGSLPMPVLGKVLRKFNEADAAGIRRPGLVVATAPSALVTAPWPATIRYRGPLLDYGNVMILEPARGYLLVLAGLGTVYGEVGDVLAAGAPVGLMSGAEPAAQEFGAEFVRAALKGGSADRTETLYMELRKGKTPVDPAEWFIQTKD